MSRKKALTYRNQCQQPLRATWSFCPLGRVHSTEGIVLEFTRAFRKYCDAVVRGEPGVQSQTERNPQYIRASSVCFPSASKQKFEVCSRTIYVLRYAYQRNSQSSQSGSSKLHPGVCQKLNDECIPLMAELSKCNKCWDVVPLDSVA